MRRRAGFTLVETLIAIIIVSALVLMAFPRVNSAMVKSNLRGGRTRLVNMFAVARAAATQGGRTAAYVRFNGNTAVVTAEPRRNLPIGVNTEDTLGVAVNLNTVYGATVSTNGVTSVKYDPRGIASNFNGSNWFKLTHGTYGDSVKIDMLGRVTK